MIRIRWDLERGGGGWEGEKIGSLEWYSWMGIEVEVKVAAMRAGRGRNGWKETGRGRGWVRADMVNEREGCWRGRSGRVEGDGRDAEGKGRRRKRTGRVRE